MNLLRGSTLLLPLLLLPLHARANKPAVKELNGSVVAGYVHEQLQGATQIGGNGFVSAPGGQEGRWGIGGALTTPILSWLGGRLVVDGGKGTLDVDALAGLAAKERSTSWVDANATVFWRDPELGYFDIGYRFDWRDPAGPEVGGKTANGLLVGAGFYIPNQGIGEFDWDASFSYGRATINSAGLDDHADEFEVDGTIGWYATPSLRLRGGVRWQQSNREIDRSHRDLRGVGELTWLLPVGARRGLSVDVFGSGGSVEQSLAAPFDSISRTVYSVGASVTFSYPGASSLLELTREYH